MICEDDVFEKEAEKWVENNLHGTEEDYIKAFKDGAKLGYARANKWHYVKDKLPPNPEFKDGEMFTKTYICAYRLNNTYDAFEVGDFMYLGNGSWNGENKEYPVYAWLDCPVEIPEPPGEYRMEDIE